MIIKSKVDFSKIPVKGDLKESVEKFVSSNGFNPAPNRKISVDIKVNVTELRKFKEYLGGDGKYVEKADLLKAANKIKFPSLKGYKVKFVYKDSVTNATLDAPAKKKAAPKKKVAVKAPVKKKVVKKTPSSNAKKKKK